MINDRLAVCVKKMEAAAKKSGRSLGDVKLVAVTKNVDVASIFKSIDNGVRDIGENKIQEALLKYDALNKCVSSHGYQLKWHMIGHLQTNKVRDAVRMFDLIHSVDSLRLAKEIDKEAFKVGKMQEVLLEVKTSAEVTKYGFLPDEVLGAQREIALLTNVKIRGLMTVAPVVDEPEKARPFFKSLKKVSEEFNQSLVTSHQPLVLSMGMTDDFEVAIEEGSTMVRIGRGIFGEREI